LVDNLFNNATLLNIKFAPTTITYVDRNNGSKLNKKYSITLKRTLLIFGILMLLCSIGLLGFSQVENKITKIVIDAGHGGKDPGALGKVTMEKDIVLDVALRTGKYIEDNIEDVEVIYTRTKDEFVELHKRAQIANESGADVFISIHCNSNKSSRPYGS